MYHILYVDTHATDDHMNAPVTHMISVNKCTVVSLQYSIAKHFSVCVKILLLS